MGAGLTEPREGVARAIWRGARRWIIRQREEAGDRALGIETMGPRGTPAATRDLRNKPYEPLPYSGLREITSRLQLSGDDVFYDLGCGKGRVLCWLAREPIARCVGVEFDPKLAGAARANAASVVGARAQIEVRTGDAAAQDYSDATVVFLYNPFGVDVLRAVLEKLAASLAASPRRLRLAYASPTHIEVFEAFPLFAPTKRISIRYDLGEMAVAFFEAA